MPTTPPAFQTITFAREGQVAVIALNRPERMHALSTAMFGELTAAIDLALAGGARCLVLTATGDRAFCSGADLQERLEDGLPDDLGVMIEEGYNPLAMKLAALEIPVVVAINGVAAGAGASLALSADITVMARSAYLLLAFVNIGLVPDAGATWFVAQSAGRARAMEMALLGERMSAETALELGLVNRVVDQAEVLPSALEIAHRLAEGPTIAMGLIRRQVNYALSHSLPETLLEERANQRVCGRTRDFGEALAGFVEKRKVTFEGR